MRFLLLLLGVLGFAAHADSVFVSTQPAGTTPSYPSQYLLKTVPSSADVVSVCDSASIPVGRTDMNNCSSARRWVTVGTVKPTDKIGYCYGSAPTVMACDISSGGGEGWQLASLIWPTIPQPPTDPAVTGDANVHWVAPIENTDGTALKDLAGFRILYGNDPAALGHMIQVNGATTTSYKVDGLIPDTYYFAVKAINTPGAESEQSNVTGPLVIGGSSCTAPKPADKINSCPAGTTGSWTQTYVAAPYPACWTATPTSAPAGSCVAIPPPVLTLKTLGGDVFTATPDYTTFGPMKVGARVGTITANVKCDATRRIVGTDYYRVPKASTTFTGTSKPDYAVAKCLLQ